MLSHSCLMLSLKCNEIGGRARRPSLPRRGPGKEECAARAQHVAGSGDPPEPAQGHLGVRDIARQCLQGKNAGPAGTWQAFMAWVPSGGAMQNPEPWKALPQPPGKIAWGSWSRRLIPGRVESQVDFLWKLRLATLDLRNEINQATVTSKQSRRRCHSAPIHLL